MFFVHAVDALWALHMQTQHWPGTGLLLLFLHKQSGGTKLISILRQHNISVTVTVLFTACGHRVAPMAPSPS
jgi:hypothetical protein